MKVISTPIEGLVIIEPKVFGDDRGYFFESYNKKTFEAALGIEVHFVQDNQARSVKNVLRGLHFQRAPFAQAKLVRVTQGAVWDVAVDLRENSTTFGQWYGIELSEQNKRQFFVPRGFAHGYAVLTDTAEFVYKCDNYYHQESDGGVIYNDTQLNIDWKINLDGAIISEKDKIQPLLKDLTAL